MVFEAWLSRSSGNGVAWEAPDSSPDARPSPERNRNKTEPPSAHKKGKKREEEENMPENLLVGYDIV